MSSHPSVRAGTGGFAARSVGDKRASAGLAPGFLRRTLIVSAVAGTARRRRFPRRCGAPERWRRDEAARRPARGDRAAARRRRFRLRVGAVRSVAVWRPCHAAAGHLQARRLDLVRKSQLPRHRRQPERPVLQPARVLVRIGDELLQRDAPVLAELHGRDERHLVHRRADDQVQPVSAAAGCGRDVEGVRAVDAVQLRPEQLRRL